MTRIVDILYDLKTLYMNLKYSSSAKHGNIIANHEIRLACSHICTLPHTKNAKYFPTQVFEENLKISCYWSSFRVYCLRIFCKRARELVFYVSTQSEKRQSVRKWYWEMIQQTNGIIFSLIPSLEFRKYTLMLH